MKITFEREKEVIGQLDKSVLELALENGIPMLNACKGEGSMFYVQGCWC